MMTISPWCAGFLGSYPSHFFNMDLSDLPQFVACTEALRSANDVAVLTDRYGLHRSTPRFGVNRISR